MEGVNDNRKSATPGTPVSASIAKSVLSPRQKKEQASADDGLALEKRLPYNQN
jgi:hypothetical protein